MKKLLFFLLGLTIAVGASAGDNSWQKRHDAKKQATTQSGQNRSKLLAKAHKAKTAAPQLRDGVPELIYEQPEGEAATYMYTYNYYDFYDNEVYTGSFIAKIVYAPDSETVYIQFYEGSPWLTATIEGNKIHMPLGQYTYYDEVEGCGDIYAWGTIVPDGDSVQFVQDNTVTEVTFTIQGRVITMDNSSGGNNGIGAVGLAEIYDDGNYCYYVEWNSTFTPYTEPSVISSWPEGEVMYYFRENMYITYDSQEIGSYEDEQLVVYAPDGKTVYLLNPLAVANTGTWVKGTLVDGKIHVPLWQYITWNEGEGNGLIMEWGTNTYDGESYTFTPDPTATEVIYTINNKYVIMENSRPGNHGDGAVGLAASWSNGDGTIELEFSPNSPIEVIYDQPEGELVNCEISYSYYYFYDNETGTITLPAAIVYDPDGETVYMQLEQDETCWLRCSIAGNKITLPMGQYQWYDEEENQGCILTWGSLVQAANGEMQFQQDPDVTEVTFTINGNVITMDNPIGRDESSDISGLAYMLDDGSETYSVMWNLEFTVTVPPPTYIHDQPEGELVTLHRVGCNLKTGSSTPLEVWTNDVYLVYAPDGKTVYIRDHELADYPEVSSSYWCWIKGTINDDGTKITVPINQYLLYYDEWEEGMLMSWGTVTCDYENEEFNGTFTPDPSVTSITFSINGRYISLDNGDCPSWQEAKELYYSYMENKIDHDTYMSRVLEMSPFTGLVITDSEGSWWWERMILNIRYYLRSPAVPADPLIEQWNDSGSENGNSYLSTNDSEPTDVNGDFLFEDSWSYSIYIDNDQLYTFEASKYGLDEDATEITYDMWYNHNWNLRPWSIHFYRTNAEGFEPFFKWRIGIQYHYTVDGVKNSSNIVYLEVFEKPNDDMPGDVDGSGNVDIDDITKMISKVLGGTVEGFIDANADLNGDHIIDIDDVTIAINMVLGNN